MVRSPGRGIARFATAKGVWAHVDLLRGPETSIRSIGARDAPVGVALQSARGSVGPAFAPPSGIRLSPTRDGRQYPSSFTGGIRRCTQANSRQGRKTGFVAGVRPSSAQAPFLAHPQQGQDFYLEPGASSTAQRSLKTCPAFNSPRSAPGRMLFRRRARPGPRSRLGQIAHGHRNRERSPPRDGQTTPARRPG